MTDVARKNLTARFTDFLTSWFWEKKRLFCSLSNVQTDATTPNIVEPAMLCERIKQLPTIEGLNGVNRRRKTAKNLADSRKNWKILTVSRK